MGLKHVFRYSQPELCHSFSQFTCSDPGKSILLVSISPKIVFPESWKVPTMMTEFFPSPLTQYVPVPIIAMPAVSRFIPPFLYVCMR
jgi:hypothetical protein